MSQQAVVVASVFFSAFWASCMIMWKAPTIAGMIMVALAGAGAGVGWFLGMRRLINKWWPVRR